MPKSSIILPNMGHITRYITELQENMRFLLSEPAGKEMLHQLRVNIKKIKALWIIHPIGSNIPFKKSFASLSVLFKLAAQTRDLQMMKTCFEKTGIFLEQTQLQLVLMAEIKKSKQVFVRKLKQKKFKLNLIEELKRFDIYYRMASRNLLKSNRRNFKQETINMFASLNDKPLAYLHEVRKNIKYLIFQNDALQVIPPLNGKAFVFSDLDKIQQQLGIWHDWYYCTEWLNLKMKEKKDSPKLQSLKKEVERKEVWLRKECLRSINLFLQHYHHPVNT